MADKKFDFLNKIRTLKRPTTGQFIWMGVGLVIAVGLFIFLRGFVTCWRLTALPGIRTIQLCRANNGTGNEPLKGRRLPVQLADADHQCTPG